MGQLRRGNGILDRFDAFGKPAAAASYVFCFSALVRYEDETVTPP